MKKVEFKCRKCEALLRIALADQEKMIRCPKCKELQRYVEAEGFRPVEAEPYADSRRSGPSAWEQQETWSLRTATGQEYHQLGRKEFENLLREGHLDTQAYFIGGDYRQWTPVQQLFQSGTRPRNSGTGSPPPPNLPAIQPLTLEGQLPDGKGRTVLALGILGLLTFCVPVISIVGVVLGLIELIRWGNNDVSGRYSVQLVTGFVLSLISLMLSGCLYFLPGI